MWGQIIILWLALQLPVGVLVGNYLARQDRDHTAGDLSEGLGAGMINSFHTQPNIAGAR